MLFFAIDQSQTNQDWGTNAQNIRKGGMELLDSNRHMGTLT
jgi:hypothetical protein